MASLYKEKSYQFSTDTGTPLNGGKVYFYTTGTLTAKNTYTSEALSVANANPVVLDADGRSANQIWISGRYRVILKTSADVTISDDDVIEDLVPASDLQDASPTWGGNNSGTANALVFAYVPAITSYTNGAPLRGRITADNSTAVTVNAGGGVKSLVKRDGAALVSGDLQGPDIIEFVYDSTTDVMRLLSPDGHLERDGKNAPARADVASAATVNLDTAGTNYVRITGTTTIAAVTLANGRWRDVVFNGALTLTNGASLILPGAANITTVAGDTARMLGEASGVVRVVNYQRGASLSGAIVQIVKTQDATADISGTATIPTDDTIPQSSEGTEYTQLATSITPKSATHLLLIEVFLPVISNSVTSNVIALFKDAETDARVAAFVHNDGLPAQATLRAIVTAGSTSAQTFKLRYGGISASTAYIGAGTAGGELFGAARIAMMTITEIVA